MHIMNFDHFSPVSLVCAPNLYIGALRARVGLQEKAEAARPSGNVRGHKVPQWEPHLALPSSLGTLSFAFDLHVAQKAGKFPLKLALLSQSQHPVADRVSCSFI